MDGEGSGDLRLASHATKALLHLKRAAIMAEELANAARAAMTAVAGPMPRTFSEQPGVMKSLNYSSTAAASPTWSTIAASDLLTKKLSPAIMSPTDIDDSISSTSHQDYNVAAAHLPSPTDHHLPHQTLPHLGDMIHLLQPSAPHHTAALHLPPPPANVPQSSASAAVHELELDIVFLHGIRGGPFITWRKGIAAAARRASGSQVGSTTAFIRSVETAASASPARQLPEEGHSVDELLTRRLIGASTNKANK
jgi:hypothetical protein